MLLRVEIENFLSFYEKSVFDLFPNLKKKTFASHIYTEHAVPVLKQSAIYGANGSGKSNILQAIGFIKQFAINKNFIEEYLIKLYKYRLLEDNTNPIKLGIEFKGEKNYYVYGFEIDIDKINEEFYISGLGKKENELIFSRSDNDVNFGKDASNEIKKATKQLLKKNKYSSLFSLNNEFPIINDASVSDAFYWFDNNLQVLSLKRFVPNLIQMMSDDKKLLDFANNIFNKIGLGVESLEIMSKNINEVFNEANSKDARLLRETINKHLKDVKEYAQVQNEKVLYTVIKENGEQIIKTFLFNQIGKDGYNGKMEIEAQSDGTVKLLNLIPALYDLIHEECTICIDEIENSIHPALISKLIEYFANTKSKGQLIFTTHETELLNQQKFMRPDEVWFAEKHEGNTKIYSLNDFKEHNTINIKNGYLEGRYGGIPFIGDLN